MAPTPPSRAASSSLRRPRWGWPDGCRKAFRLQIEEVAHLWSSRKRKWCSARWGPHGAPVFGRVAAWIQRVSGLKSCCCSFLSTSSCISTGFSAGKQAAGKSLFRWDQLTGPEPVGRKVRAVNVRHNQQNKRQHGTTCTKCAFCGACPQRSPLPPPGPRRRALPPPGGAPGRRAPCPVVIGPAHQHQLIGGQHIVVVQ